MRLRDVPYRARHLAVVAAVALGTSACESCSKGSGERPIRFVSKDADAVFEIRDLGMLAKAKNDIAAALSPMVPAEQLAALEQELTLSLGFNPASEQGLAEAGLPKSGPIAVQISGVASSALWILPVADTAKLEKTIDKVARARTIIESTTKDQNITILSSKFGPETITVAAYTFAHGLAFVGAGPNAKELVTKALAPELANANILGHPEYVALEKALPQNWDARIVIPAVTGDTNNLATILSQIPGPVARAYDSLPEVGGVKSAGWSANFEKRALEVQGRIRLKDEAIAKVKTAFEGVGVPPEGVRATALEDAVVYAYAAMNPKNALATFAPEGSRARTRLQPALDKIKADIGTDIEREVVPLLSGHASLAVGLRSLSGLDLRQIAQDPRVLWVMFGFGSPNPAELYKIEARMDQALIDRKLIVGTRKVDEVEVHTVAKSDGIPDKPNETIVETMTLGGARVFSTESPYTDRAVKQVKTAPQDPLGAKPGAFAEVRFSALSKGLSQLDMSALPILYRAIAAKVLEALRLLDTASLAVTPAEDGLAIKARIQLVPASAAK